MKLELVARIWRAVFRVAPLRVWAMIGAGPALTVLLIWMTWVIWQGGWPVSLRGEQLHYIGVLAVMGEVLIGVIVTALAAVRVHGQVPGGAQFEIDGAPGDEKKKV